jgi:outer membrane protein
LGYRPIENLLFLVVLFSAAFCLHACVLRSPKSLLDYAGFAKVWPLSKKEDKSPQVAQPPPTPSTAAPFKWSPPEGPLRMTLSEAVVIALANNQELQVQKLKPPITSTNEQEELAKFDPVARADAERSRERTANRSVTQGFKAHTGVSKYLPTGTTLDVEAGTEWSEDMPPGTDPDSNWQAFPRLSVTQALLRGAGVDVNLATYRQARLDTAISQYQLTGLAQALTAELENAYWDYYLALGQIDIYDRSLNLAKRLLRETRDRIALGQKARSEIYFFEAEAASREQSLIDAKSFREKNRLRLLRLISPPSVDLWNRDVRLLTPPRIPRDSVEDLKTHIQVAMQMRPDINEARLEEQKGVLEIVKTRNGLLPKLDFFMMLGRSGYSRSFSGSVHDITAGEGGLDFIARLNLEFPLLNRKAGAQYTRSVLTLAQERDAIANLIQLAQHDVLQAYVEIRRAREQMKASQATVHFQREKREAEIEKYRLGTSNAYRAAQTERDAVTSEVSALQARIDYLKGLTQFYLAEGTLLARRGIGYVPQGN